MRDTDTGAFWSAGYQPSGREADTYEVSYSEDQATFARRDGSIATGLTIMVSAEDDAEIRRVSLTNLGSRVRELELTSYQEVVLAPQAADVAHPAFQNLFVQTEYDAETGALLATRRPRSNDEERLWAAHVAMVDDHADGVIQYETDRARFLGRGRSVRSAASVVEGRPLSNSVGAVLDPIFSLRRRVVVEPGETVHAIFATVVAESRDQVIDLADKYRTPATFERARILAWTHAQVQLHHLGIDAGEAHLFQRLANRLLYSDPSLRPPAERARRQPARGVRTLAVRDLRRPADRGGPHRPARRRRHRSPAVAGARVLAPEGARRRRRDRQRARRHLCRRPPRVTRESGAGEPVDARPPEPSEPRRRLRPARRAAERR